MRPIIHVYHSIYNVQKKHLTNLASPSNLHSNLNLLFLCFCLFVCKEYLTRVKILSEPDKNHRKHTKLSVQYSKETG